MSTPPNPTNHEGEATSPPHTNTTSRTPLESPISTTTLHDPNKLTPAGRRALFAAVLGTLIEWYDYALYGAAAGVVIGPLFFKDFTAGQQLATFATFAVGFIARPLGGLIIGHIGDSFGRRPAMMASILMMGIATVAMGLLPTAAAVGILAPILLVLLRLIQGLGAGAELAGAMTLVAEFAPPAKRGLLTSAVLSMPPLGIVAATGAFLAVSSLGDATLLGWAWRVPFLISAVLFALAVFIRRRLEETPEYVEAMSKRMEAEKQRVPVVELWRKHARSVITAFMAVTGHNCLNYAMAVFAIGFMVSPAVGLDRSSALAAVTIGTLFGVVTTPVGGLLADRFGSGKILATGCFLGAIYAFPFMKALASGSALTAGIAIAFGYGVVIAMTSGAQGSYLAGLFPAAERFSGIALAREANGAVVAGFTPLMLTAILRATDGSIYAAATAIAICLILSLIAIAIGTRSYAATDVRAR